MPLSATLDTSLRRHFVVTLTDPSRLALLNALRDGEMRVTDLAASTGLSQPNVSKHLSCLRGCGLVERDRRGREVFYWTVAGVDEVFEAIDSLLGRVAEQVASCELTPTVSRRSGV